MDRLSLVLAIFSIAIIVAVLASVRREHIRVEYSVSWLTAALVMLSISGNPGFVQWLSEMLGLQQPQIAALVVLFGISVVVIYRLSLRVSALKDASIALAQRVAILEYQLKSGHEERQESNKS